MSNAFSSGIFLVVAGAAIGGVIAFAIWSLLPQTWRPASWPVAIVVALMTALNLMSYARPSAEEDLLNNPETQELAHAWKSADPNGFAAFARRVRDVANGASPGPAVELNLAVAERLPRLSDADIVSLEHNTRDMLLFYADANPSVCAAIVQGRPSVSVQRAMNETAAQAGALRRHRLDLIARAFRAAPDQPISAMSSEETHNALLGVGANLRQSLPPGDLALLTSGSDIAGHEKSYCLAMAAYEDALASAPDAARLYRGILLRAEQHA